MRTGIPGLCSPRPFVATMPSVYWGDPLAEQLCDAFDEVLAPVFTTLDCLPAYLDPRTTPADMLDWLAGWIGLTVGGRDPAHKRELIMAGTAALASQGTAQSIHDAVVAAYHRPTEVIESGSATWSLTPDSRPAGQPVPSLVVRVTVSGPGGDGDGDDAASGVDERSLYAFVDAIKPAHIPHRVELVTVAAAITEPPPPLATPPTTTVPEPEIPAATPAAEPPDDAKTQMLRLKDLNRPKTSEGGEL